MADNCSIREYTALAAAGIGSSGQLGQEPPVDVQALEVDTSAVTSAAFHQDTRFIFVSCAVAGLIEFGDAPELAFTSRPLIAAASAPDGGQWFGVYGGMKAILLEGTTIP